MNILKYVALFSFIVFSAFSYADNSTIGDTIVYKNKRIVLNKDNTWKYIDIVENYISRCDSVMCYEWEEDEIFSYTSKPSLKDTIWLDMRIDSNRFSIPFPGKVLRTMAGAHKGVDIRLSTGDPVRSAFDGKVRYAKYNHGGFGNMVIIRHCNGLETYYAHLSRMNVDINDEVKAGDIIGLGGNTGRSTGPHLHFEVRYMDRPISPTLLFDFEKNKLVSLEFNVNSKPEKEHDIDGYKVPVAQTKFHTVKKGESLSIIGRKYGTTPDKIAKLNKISKNSPIRPGQKLRVK